MLSNRRAPHGGEAAATIHRAGFSLRRLLVTAGETREEVRGAVARDLVTGLEIWLPTGNRVSRAPTVSRVTEQKIPNLFENFEF
jgi:hypothetical protein